MKWLGLPAAMQPALIALLVGLLVGGGAGFGLGKLVYQGRALRAEKAVAEVETAIAKGFQRSAEKNLDATNDIRSDLNANLIRIEEMGTVLDRIRRDARVCASNSAMQISRSAAGADAAPADGQPRPAEEVLQELTAEGFERADQNAAIHNALVDWIEAIRKQD